MQLSYKTGAFLAYVVDEHLSMTKTSCIDKIRLKFDFPGNHTLVLIVSKTDVM